MNSPKNYYSKCFLKNQRIGRQSMKFSKVNFSVQYELIDLYLFKNLKPLNLN